MDAPDGADGGDQATNDNLLSCTQTQFENVSIPMRDGKSLAAFVRRPLESSCRMPTVLIQTPYDKENARSMWFAQPAGEPLFASTDYAFVVVDWRGFFGSKDAAVSGTQPYAQDGYDTVEWIASQSWSDGKVGTWGVSALCIQQYRTALQKPPHLAAAVPIFCEMNTTYEQYYPGGVLRQEYFDFISSYFGGGDIIKAHSYHDLTWSAVEKLYSAANIAVPMMVVSGWYDLFNTGTLLDFQALQAQSASGVRNLHRLLIGPWIHFAVGGETSGAGRQLDAEEMLYVDTAKRIQHDSLAFFDLHLRGLQSEAASWAAARWILGGAGGEESGPTWPPSGASTTVFFLAGDGTLASTTPAAANIDFPYDPNNPSPTIGGSTLIPSLAHGPRAQDEVLARNDAVAFVSAPLQQPLTLRGAVTVAIEASTTGADTDFAVRLTDVGTDGKHLLIGDGIQRLKLRDNLAQPSAVQAGQRYSLTTTLTNQQGYTFAAGHKVGLILSSSNYSRFARNPNNGQDFYQDAASAVTVTNTLYLDGGSRLILPKGN